MNPAAGAPNMSLSKPPKIIMCGVGKLQKMACKESRPRGPGFGLSLEGGFRRLCSVQPTHGVLASGSTPSRREILDYAPEGRAYGSENAMVYWKKIPTPIFCNFKQRSLGFSDAWSSTAIYHHSLKLLQAQPIISDLLNGPGFEY